MQQADFVPNRQPCPSNTCVTTDKLQHKLISNAKISAWTRRTCIIMYTPLFTDIITADTSS